MDIVHIAPPFLPLDPNMNYGGIERVINLLRSEQHNLGFPTKVIAPSNSVVDGVIPTIKSIGVDDIYEKNLTHNTVRTNTYAKLAHIYLALSYISKNPSSIFHIHDDYLLPFMSGQAPMLMTVHSDYSVVWQTEEHPWLRGKEANLVALSQSHKKNLESHGLQISGVVYNGIDVENFPFIENKKDYLLSLSAVVPHKGQHIAVQTARLAGTDLVIAGNIGDIAYFNTFKHKIDYDLSRADDKDKFAEYCSLPGKEGGKIVYVGQVNDAQKKPLYANAKGFLMPILWEEAFGLVAIEALACGTPIITFNRGALPELVVDGKTGFICTTPNEMARLVEELHKIDPHDCRKDAEQRFSANAMAKEYIRLYSKMASEHQRPHHKL